MLKKDELKVLKLLFDDLTRSLTISDISRILKQKYFQTYRTISSLQKIKLIEIQSIGNSKIVKLNLSKSNPEYLVAELSRTKDKCKNKTISIIKNQIEQLNKNFICILFGSYAVNKQKKSSDIDLLFVIPDQYELASFEKLVKIKLSPYNCDINITTETGLIEMWQHPKKLTVGTELLKKHLVLYGGEHFLNLLRYRDVG
ncbi:nucleotidyltransferase domain-containing protein [Candidatus Woesearchaeota archaeon]|jgi:predicted nucleotidyltransferase|nr:nucleotidyltransferase domain-containing protein [Candidatus Woesearchaeota archaeon]MBT6518977.1 nucleotidyltransferase domain-containing protein [Candidatus Woesearchaeota archaeon]MBT7368342.1 nucleotidyltransferase domain-containing protein [Candidatus Woesearchaeota archaeon]